MKDFFSLLIFQLFYGSNPAIIGVVLSYILSIDRDTRLMINRYGVFEGKIIPFERCEAYTAFFFFVIFVIFSKFY